jgi:hypothetical protein
MGFDAVWWRTLAAAHASATAVNSLCMVDPPCGRTTFF